MKQFFKNIFYKVIDFMRKKNSKHRRVLTGKDVVLSFNGQVIKMSDSNDYKIGY